MNGSRIGSLALGAALVALGGTLVLRTRGNSDAPAVPYGKGSRVVKVFTIARPADDLYAYWRDFSNLPKVMSHLDRVDVNGTRSHWHAHTNGGVPVSWDAEIITDEPGQRIAWRTVGGPFQHAGSVRFQPAPGDRGTEVRAEIEWTAVDSAGLTMLAKLFGQDPALAVESDLRRFKSLMEAGDIALNGAEVKA